MAKFCSGGTDFGMNLARSKCSPLASHSCRNFSQARRPRQFSSAKTSTNRVTRQKTAKPKPRSVRQRKIQRR